MLALRLRHTAVLCLLFICALTARAQDTRTVTQPVIPPSCTVLTSTMAIVAGEPASETAFDTSRIQAALTACPAGQAVELALSGSNDAFLIQPINIPSGVTLLVDGGVTVFASRNPADYQVSGAETCGTVGTSGTGCKNLISIANNGTSSGSGIMGYGIIDGRGEDKLLVNGVASTSSWWDIANAANGNGAQNNFILMQTSKSNNFTLYGITVKNSAMFHLKWSGTTGYTVWDVKVITPYTARNTDGLDVAGTNVTIMNSSISDGDDDVAVSGSNAASNMTVANTNTYSGHGISIGSFTQGGFTNLLVNNVNMAGTAADSNATGLRIKSALDRGGLVQNVTYQNMCLQNMKTMISLTPFYNTNTGTLIPQFKNIYFHNLNFLTEGTVGIQGYDINHITTAQFDGVVFQNLKATDITPASQDTTLTLGPGVVYPAALQTWSGSSATGVTVTGTAAATNTPWSACPTTVFPYLTGDLYIGNNKQTTSINLTNSVTLNAMVQPAMSQVSYGGSSPAAALTKSINFLEGVTVVGTGTLSANGTLASATITPITSGVHTYTAQYPADTNYAATTPFNFGSVTVVVTGTTASTTTVSATPATSTYGSGNTTITATIAGIANTPPTGTVQFYDNAVPLGSAVTATTLSASAGTSTAVLATALAGGTHSITAVYFGDLTYDTSTNATAASVTVNTATSTTTLAALPASASFGASITLTATVTPGAGTAKPNSSVNFMEGSTVLGSATVNTSGVATFPITLPIVGLHTYTAAYVGDSNYSPSANSASQSETITLATSTTTLTALPASTTLGSTVTMTATVTNTAGVVATGTVTFKDGTATIGTPVTLNASGVATATIATLATGSHSITAVYSGDANFSASTSTVATEAVSVPFTVTVPATMSAAIGGAAATATVTVTPAAIGYSGLVTFGCSAPVLYVTCNVTPTSVTLAGATVMTSTLSVSVLSTVSEVRPAHSHAFYAVLLPFAGLLLLPFTRRRATRGLAICLMLCALAAATLGMTGCNPTTGTTTTPGAKPSTGTVPITITGTGATYLSTTSLTLTVTN